MTRIFSRLLSILILWCYSASPNLAQNIANPSPQTPPQISLGTGFVVADGYLLTAMHVVRDKDSIWVGPIDGKRWVKIEDKVRTNLNNGVGNDTLRSGFVNNTYTTPTTDMGNIPSRQSLSQILKPQADNGDQGGNLPPNPRPPGR